MSMLAFLPWLPITEPIEVAEFELLPFQRGSAPAGEETQAQRLCDTALAPYYVGDAPIFRAAVVRMGRDAGITRDLSDDERAALFVFSEVLATSGLAAREFFGSRYLNRDNLRLIIQSQSGVGGAAITSRRRDGSSMNYWPEGAYRVQKPEHIPLPPGWAPNLDLELLESLLSARASSHWGALYEAVLGFNMANTDSADISEHIEAVLLVGAFERLLDCHRGKEDDLAEKFTASLAPTESLAPSHLKATSSDRLGQFEKAHCLRDMWMRDFFRLRGNLAHGKVESRYVPVWSLRNHLLLGSVAFPLVLKLKLGELGSHTLSREDQDAINMFEHQVLHDHFAPVADSYDRSAYPWNQVKREALLRRWARRLSFPPDK